MNDLGLDLTELTRRGRKSIEMTAEAVRPLTTDDLLSLKQPTIDNAPIKRISDRHHRLAKLLASGVSEGEAALAVGYEPARVSILKGSPAFLELLSFYQQQLAGEFEEFGSQLASLATDAVAILRERLEEAPEAPTLGQLLEIAKFGADRTGFGPTAKTETTVKMELGSRLTAARQRLEQQRLASMMPIDITPVEE